MSSSLDAPGTFVLGNLRTTASHTIGIPHLTELLRTVPPGAPYEQYRQAVVDDNVLGRSSHTGRLRSLRHLRELYFLDPRRAEFAALRQLYDAGSTSNPLIAGVLAFSRDGILRASFQAVQSASIGSTVTSADLTAAVKVSYGAELSDSTLDKIGRNTGASWTQTGHLSGRTNKVRQRVEASPSAVTYAAYLGYLSGKRGLSVLDTPSSALLDLAPADRLEALRSAHRHGLLDLLVAGNVVDVNFPKLPEASR